jgi:hypothetical protein
MRFLNIEAGDVNLSDKNLYMICMLHGLMSHARGAIKLTMLYILNQSDSQIARQTGRKMTKHTDETKVSLFNQNFKKYGIGCYAEAEGSTTMADPSCKGIPSWNMIRDIAESITEDAEGYFTAQPHCPLKNLDEQQDTLKLWVCMYRVFRVAKLEAPSHEEIRQYSNDCFYLKRAWRERGFKEDCVPYYIHLVCDHSPELLELWGSLWIFSNQMSESFNKILNGTWLHTMGQGGNGRANQQLKAEALAKGLVYKQKDGKAQEAFGLVACGERMILRYSFLFEHELEMAMKEVEAQQNETDLCQEMQGLRTDYASPAFSSPESPSKPSQAKKKRA